MSLLDIPPCLPPKSPKSILAIKQLGLIAEDFTSKCPYHKIPSVQAQLIKKHQEILDKRIKEAINQRQILDNAPQTQSYQLTENLDRKIEYFEPRSRVIKSIDPQQIIYEKQQLKIQRYNEKKIQEQTQLVQFSQKQRIIQKQKQQENKEKKDAFEQKLDKTNEFLNQKLRQIKIKYIEKDKQQEIILQNQIQEKQNQLKCTQLTRAQKELEMHEIRRNLTNQHYESNLQLIQQKEQVFNRAKSNILQKQKVRTDEIKQFYNEKHEKIQEIMEQFMKDLEGMEKQIEVEIELAQKRHDKQLKIKQTEVSEKIKEKSANQNKKFSEILKKQKDLQISTINQIEEMQEKAKASKNDFLDQKKQFSYSTLLNSQIGRVRSKMLESQTKYDGQLQLYHLNQVIQQVNEVKKDPDFKKQLMQSYTFKDIQQKEIKTVSEVFSLQEFLNFNDLGEGFYKGQQLKIMHDRAQYMEDEREKIRQQKIDGADSELQKVTLRQMYCKERRESQKILKVLEGMYKVEGKGRII
ncbi:hypothetical protein SS50377_25758 [Spironucleus salmonicida]|uniref:Uncharacterized protein n=1 Tax=Spironucleus salmonicida TaxID=348837 RepID=V6LUM1_9EUKA|nr:hypothetical protein SS50377_25758 [Spironucleus salmonicida]|eukprot:EST48265.1 Hypothetical protein SS50377_11606 [Spironucleus salmonicida]